MIYSAIDALAALTRESRDTSATRNEFQEWVRTYLLPQMNCGLTALDIYGARCGVVHTYAPTSDLSRTGQAKVIVYNNMADLLCHEPWHPVVITVAA